MDHRKIYTNTGILLQDIAKYDRVVFTNGCFDLLHIGHVDLLSKAKKLGDVLIVGLNTDDSIRGLKGKDRPICKLEDRAVMLASLELVDFVIPFDEPTPLRLIKAINPDVLVKGGDYKASEVVGYKEVKANGGVVEIINFTHQVSSTQLIDKIRSINYDPSSIN